MIIPSEDSDWYEDTLSIGYTGFDALQTAVIQGSRLDIDTGKQGHWSCMQELYNANGGFNAVIGAQSASSKRKSILSEEAQDLLLQLASDTQRRSGYAVDEWHLNTLSKGDIVYGGLPKPSAFYTSEETVLSSGLQPEKLFQRLQVKKDAELGYRGTLGKYEVIRPTTLLTGKAKKNPQYGSGGGEQYFVSKHNENLALVEKIPLAGEEREYLEKLNVHLPPQLQIYNAAVLPMAFRCEVKDKLRMLMIILQLRFLMLVRIQIFYRKIIL